MDRWVHHFNAPAGGDPMGISGQILPVQKLERLSYQRLKPHDRIFICLDTIPQCDKMTHRQTDGITLASTALCIASNADAL